MNIFNVVKLLLDNFVLTVIGLFPTANSNTLSTITSGTTTFRGYLQSASFLFPVNQLLLILGAILSIEVALFGYRGVKFILSYLSAGFLRE